MQDVSSSLPPNRPVRPLANQAKANAGLHKPQADNTQRTVLIAVAVALGIIVGLALL